MWQALLGGEARDDGGEAARARRGRAVQDDLIKTRVESTPAFSA